jgi:uncharacterized protein YutE (UPF0331/DUF86 family)
MVDVERLLLLLERIAAETRELRRLSALDDVALADGSDALAAVKYRFVVAIEAAVDVCRHVAASEGLRVPNDMREAFVVLQEAGWLPPGDLPDMAGFRNLLVHQYAAVDDERVRQTLRTRLDDLDAFRKAVAERASTG